MSISLDCEDKLECPACEGNLLIIHDVEINKRLEEIQTVVIQFKCINCNESIHSLNIANKDSGTHILFNRQDDHYASAVKNMFKKS